MTINILNSLNIHVLRTCLCGRRPAVFFFKEQGRRVLSASMPEVSVYITPLVPLPFRYYPNPQESGGAWVAQVLIWSPGALIHWTHVLDLNWAMLTSVPISIVYKQHHINSPLSRKLHFVPFNYCKPHKWAMSSGHFQCLRKLNRFTFGVFSVLER